MRTILSDEVFSNVSFGELLVIFLNFNEKNMLHASVMIDGILELYYNVVLKTTL